MKIRINYIFWKQGPLLPRLLTCKKNSTWNLELDNVPFGDI